MNAIAHSAPAQSTPTIGNAQSIERTVRSSHSILGIGIALNIAIAAPMARRITT